MSDQADLTLVPQPSGPTLHLTPEAVWLSQAEYETYQPEPFADEGFIHCTDGESALIEVANAFYRADPRPYLVLVIDLARVSAPVRYEDPDCVFPHLYGPLNRDAVVAVRPIERRDDGTFVRLQE